MTQGRGFAIQRWKTSIDLGKAWPVLLWKVRVEFGGFPSGDTAMGDTKGTPVTLRLLLRSKTARQIAYF